MNRWERTRLVRQAHVLLHGDVQAKRPAAHRPASSLSLSPSLPLSLSLLLGATQVMGTRFFSAVSDHCATARSCWRVTVFLISSVPFRTTGTIKMRDFGTKGTGTEETSTL